MAHKICADKRGKNLITVNRAIANITGIYVYKHKNEMNELSKL